MAEQLSDIDRIDRKILSVWQDDCRISNLKLAETVALSPTAVLARVQRLTRNGYIRGYEARLDLRQPPPGAPVHARPRTNRPLWAPVATPSLSA